MSGFTLKIIAIFTMFIDHIGNIYHIDSFRVVGRIAFPVFMLLCAESCKYTRDIQKYMDRLLVFAFISEIPYRIFLLATENHSINLRNIILIRQTNVFFTLFLATFSIYLINMLRIKFSKIIVFFIVIFYLFFLSYLSDGILRCDYGIYGITAIIACYFFEKKYQRSIITFTFVVLSNLNTSYLFYPLIAGGLFAIIILSFYNGTQGLKMKFLFYLFYPLHFLLISFIKLI